MSTTIKYSDTGWHAQTAAIVPDWKTPEEWQPGDALLLAVDAEPDPAYRQASAIGIEFPAFTDGRGLSLAVLLRTRINFTGELRALGAIHEDVLHYMVRCGFDALELPAERDTDTALRLLFPYSGHYQNSVSPAEEVTARVQRWA
jgi:uncharacterized protein (DUF934 family)